MRSVTNDACCVTQRNSTLVGALHTTGDRGPVNETIRAAGALVVGAIVAGIPVDGGEVPVVVVVAADGAVVLVEELAWWLLEQDAKHRQATAAVRKVTRDRRTTRS
jgi:hypothetical protein